MPYGIASGAGVIFGVTGGVTEAVIRAVAGTDRTAVEQIAFTGVRGFDGVKEVQIPYGDRELSIAIVSGLRNAENLLNAVKRGEVKYDFIEVMACRGGCIAGAGQPFDPKNAAKEERATGMYDTDRMSNVRVSQNNPVTEGLYNGLLKGRNAHRLLHYK